MTATTCPGCARAMTALTLEGHSGEPITIDSCAVCHAFWFDTYESLKLSPASTLKLFTHIGEATTHEKVGAKPTLPATMSCPRCRSRLVLTHDRQRDTPFQYWRCDHRHGRFITFFHFLREKSFIKTLSATELAEVRQHVQMVNCSNCGGPVDLNKASACPHCGSPLSILDMKQAEALVGQLRDASTPRPIDPALPMNLIRARREVEAAFADGRHSQEWWRDASSQGLVEAGLAAIAGWLKPKD